MCSPYVRTIEIELFWDVCHYPAYSSYPHGFFIHALIARPPHQVLQHVLPFEVLVQLQVEDFRYFILNLPITSGGGGCIQRGKGLGTTGSSCDMWNTGVSRKTG